MSNPQYCVAILTLGTAGEKYRQTLLSLQQQTIPPNKILVYIAQGYPIPQETIGIEEYIYCPKGMVAQRSLPFDEIDTEWILFLDDDIYIPHDGVEKLFAGLKQFNADCIAPNTFPNHNMSFKNKIKAILCSQTFPHRDKRWAFKIRRSGHYSYNNAPNSVMPTQSSAFTCLLCRKEAYKAIHFEDEKWIDHFKYALGDDQLFFYKLYLYGYNILIHYKCGITHLDAQSGNNKNYREAHLNTIILRFIIWWRTRYSIQKKRREKLFCILSFGGANLIYLSYSIIHFIVKRKWYILSDLWIGNRKGYEYVHSDEYLSYPDYLAHYTSKTKDIHPTFYV